jgi:ABC-type uncharacterized transport system ATPase component
MQHLDMLMRLARLDPGKAQAVMNLTERFVGQARRLAGQR